MPKMSFLWPSSGQKAHFFLSRLWITIHFLKGLCMNSMIKLVKHKWRSLQTRTLLGSHDSWSHGLCPYALKKINSIKFKMPNLWPLLTSICVISGRLCQIVRSLVTIKQNVRCQVGICPGKLQLGQMQSGPLSAIIDFIMRIIWKTESDG